MEGWTEPARPFSEDEKAVLSRTSPSGSHTPTQALPTLQAENTTMSFPLGLTGSGVARSGRSASTLSFSESTQAIPPHMPQPRPRRISDLIREKLGTASTREAHRGIGASNGPQRTSQGPSLCLRQEEDGGVRLAGGRLSERLWDGDWRGRELGINPQEGVRSIERHSIMTLPPPYAER